MTTDTTPIVAIVGRPNVGKSTLFNRLAGESLAIVHDAPGVTRDRNYADTHVAGRDITLIDTGGFDSKTDDPMGQGITRHVKAAIEEADVVICVLDGSSPPTAPDRDAFELLRRSEKPVVYVANKIDGPKREWDLAELYQLGVGDLIGISALHGRHTGALEAALAARLPERTQASEADPDEDLLHIAFVGRPNAGKSSLFNRLSGTERSLVDSRPGTTRDPIDSIIEFKGSRYHVVDTAGIRRKSRVEKGVESQSVMRSIRAIGRAHVIVLMSDVTQGISDQDANLLGLCADRGRAIVVGLNKVDLFKAPEIKKAKEEAAHSLHFARWAPIVPLSAQTGQGVGELMKQISHAGSRMKKRIPTSAINKFFESIIRQHPPPPRSGKAPRIYYLTQTSVNPPTFVAFCSSKEHIADTYKRFITNRIRDTFDYQAVPLRLLFRNKSRDLEK